MVACLLLVLFPVLILSFLTSFTLISGQKYALPEGVGELHQRV